MKSKAEFWRPPDAAEGAEGDARYTRRVAQRDVTKTSTACEAPRGADWKPLCAGVRQRRGRPEGNEGWTSRRRQPQGLPRGHPSSFRCAPECDSEEAAPRATRAGRQDDVSHKACPEGVCRRILKVEG